MRKGILYAVPIKKAPKLIEAKGTKIFGVRFAKFIPHDWIHLSDLSPNKNLLLTYQKKRKEEEQRNKEFNRVDFFKKNYYNQFIKELNQSEKGKNEFRFIKSKLDAGEDVYYACYCDSYEYCHRGIVAELFERLDYEVQKE